jgi:hypothetical protein
MKVNLLFCLLLVLLFQISANASSTRKFYLTKNGFYGDQTLTACAHGYHMASLFELAVTSDLQYNTTLGYSVGDSGFGPAQLIFGWVRTGLASDIGINCDGWTTSTSLGKGVTTAPFINFQTGPIAITWTVQAGSCSDQIRVWCVED